MGDKGGEDQLAFSKKFPFSFGEGDKGGEDQLDFSKKFPFSFGEGDKGGEDKLVLSKKPNIESENYFKKNYKKM